MIDVRLLGPGSSVPHWAELLEAEEFGAHWGPLGELEMMWLLDGCAFARWRAVPKIGEAELLRMAVCQDQRRKGMARRLLEGCMKYLSENGCAALRLEVRVSNFPAQRLYQAVGWQQDGLRGGYYGDGEDAAVYMWPPGGGIQTVASG